MNLVDINSASGVKATPKEDLNYHYTIILRDGSTHEAFGYLLLNSIFVGVAQGEGILQVAFPTSEFLTVVNNGPVGTAQ